MPNLRDLKEYLKLTAFSIKANKPLTKGSYDSSSYEKIRAHWELVGKIQDMRREFRHHLVAYCEMRGLSRERIEKPADNNRPNEDRIREIKGIFEPHWGQYEALHTGS